MEISDKEIILKIKNGEIDYFTYIVKKYSPKISHFIFQKLFKKEDVEDIVQNVFLNFYKAISRFDENRKIAPYLFQIVNNELKMYYRCHKKTVSLDESICLEDDRLVDNNWEDYLKELPKDQRDCLELLSKGFSYLEIANKSKKPVNTVRTLIRRGRINLKKIYEKT